jgi:hypothetical protein
MKSLKKQLILLFTNFLLLAGIGTTIANYSTSVFEGQAYTNQTLTINRSASGIPIQTISYTDSNTYIITDSSGSQTVSITGSFTSTLNQTTIQFKQAVANSSDPIDDRRGWWSTTPTPGYITKITINPAATNAPSYATKEEAKNVMGSTTISTPVVWTFSRNKMYRYFNFTPNSNNSHLYNSVVIEYEVPESDTEAVVTFAEYFLSNTENKNGQCTIEGLNWTNVSSTYNTLTTNQKSLFVSESANASIANAVSRYQYLRTISQSLNNFANL